MVNWNVILDNLSESTLNKFADGELSGRTLTSLVKRSDAAGEVRFLLRKNGVDKARMLARKALYRRYAV